MQKTTRRKGTPHLKLRGRTYHAVMEIPKDLRKRLGKRRFMATLGTDSLQVAQRRVVRQIAMWRKQITEARGEGGDANEDDPAYWRRALRNAKDDKQRQIILDEIEWKAYDIGSINVPEVGMNPHRDPEAIQFYFEAIGAVVPTLEYLEEWITSLQVTAKTAAMRKATIGRLAEKFPMLKDVSRKEVRRWATELMAELKPATVQRMMTDCRTYWRYLETIEAVPEESAPFDKLGLKVPRAARLPWSAEELLKLYQSAEEKDQILADLIRLAMYSGARLGELVNLKTDDVAEDHFRIVDAKTEAGVRAVPIHREVAQTIARLVDQSEDGYVLSGIKGQHRVDTMSNAFQRLRKQLGLTDKRQVFHSIRNTVITKLEEAQVQEATVAAITGHSYPTMTFGLYSGGVSLERKAEALAKLRY